MSTSTTITPASAAPASIPRLLTPTTTAIPLPGNRTARTYSHMHTALVLAYFILRFRALVADPLETMAWDLIPLSIENCAFSAICLPSAGTWGEGGQPIIEGTASARPGKGGGTGSMRRKQAPIGGAGDGRSTAVAQTWQAKITPTILSLTLTFLLPPLPLALLALLIGAPIYPYTLLPLTLLLAIHISLLALLPLFYTHGVSQAVWRDVLAAWLPFDRAGVWGGSVGAFVGGWFGAVPIALDWDREWQKWPVTVLVGVYLGWAVGRVLTGGLGWGVGKRINMDAPEEELVRVRRRGVEVTEEKKQT